MHQPDLRPSTRSSRRATRGAAAIVIVGLVAGSQLPIVSAASAKAVDPIAGGQSAGDVLFPNQGNTGYDSIHYDIDLKVNVAVSSTNNAVSTTTFPEATTTVSAATTGAPLSSYSFDFQGSTGNLDASTLNIDSVTVNGVAADFSRIETTTVSNATTDVHKLIITPSTPVDGAFTTVVKYHGRPVAHTDTDGTSEGWNATTDGATFVNQPMGSMTAFPNNNTPNDKATYTISVDAPSQLTTSATAVAANPGLKDAAVVSNGELVSKTPSADGTRTRWVWNESKQMASELSLISIGRYKTFESDILLASGRTLHEWSFIDPAISVSNQLATQATRAQLKSILDFLESKYGPYPGNSVGIVTDVVPSAISYALETQDRPIFPNSANRATTIHELTHQWLGDNVAPKVWNDIWISEGGATYSENQTAFESSGTSTFSNETLYYTAFANSSPTSSLWTIPSAGMTQADQLFLSQVYTRGSWALEALRTAIGPVNFAKLMLEDQSRNGGKARSSANFIALAEEISGKDLTAFFQQWIYANTKATWPSKFTLSLVGPAAQVNVGDTVSYTLSSRNTGKVAQSGSVVTVDASKILDKATLGVLPSGVTLDGTTLTWAVPNTAVGATSTAAFTAVVNAGATGSSLAATASTPATTLGATCVECTTSVVVGVAPVSPSADPTITGGAATVGQPLTADTSGWLADTTFAYQWLADGTPIVGATNATYTPDATVVGLTLAVKVTGSNGSLSPYSRTSAATAATVKGAFASAPVPTISGTPQFGKTLVVSTGTWDTGTYFTYQWLVNGVVVSSNNGGTGPFFTPSVASQSGTTISVTITGSKAGRVTTSKTSAVTGPVVAGEFASTPTPAITVTPRALAATPVTTGQWDDGTTLTYQWSVDGTTVTGATGATYTPTIAQIGSTLSVAVTGTKPGFPTTTKSSAASAPVGPAAQVLTPTPIISGTPKVDTELTLDPGTWDADTTLSYQWLLDGVAVEGATSLTFTPTAADAGKVVTVAVTSTKPNYATTTKTSAPSEKIASGDLVLTGDPTISGTPKVGVELSASTGTWDAGTQFAYQWLSDGNPVAAATSATFIPTPDTVGTAISLAVTGSKSGYVSVTKTSSATEDVALGDFTVAPTPTVSGIAKVGVTLTAVAGTWDDGTALTYQWFTDGIAIEGAIASEYTPGADKVGSVISVSVTGMKDGYNSLTRTSEYTAPVAVGDLQTTPKPTIDGVAQVGRVLTGLVGTWDSGTTLTYQWYVSEVAVDGATSTEYTPTPGVLGKTIVFEVTGAKPGHATVVRSSDATAAVASGDLVATPVPTVSGTYMVGKTVKALPGLWDEGVTFTYQWRLANKVISGATAATYRMVPADRSHTLSVVVTGSKDGYTAVSKASVVKYVAAGVQSHRPKPTITGTTKVGHKLSVKSVTYDSNVTRSYTWYADGHRTGSDNRTLTLTKSMKGKRITVRVVATKPGYVTFVSTSTKTAKIK